MMIKQKNTVYKVKSGSLAEKYLREDKPEDNYNGVTALTVIEDGENVESLGTLAAFSFEKINKNEERTIFDLLWGCSDITRVVVPEKHKDCIITEVDFNQNYISEQVREVVISTCG